MLDAWDGAAEAVVERVHANMGAAARRAEAQGVTIVIENIEEKDPRGRVALAASFDSPAVRVSLDTGYAHGATGAPPVDRYVRAAGAMLAHVHLQDADGYADRHWPPGRGTICWPAVFEQIALLPETPRLILELRDPAEIVPGAERLAELGLAL